MLFVITDGVEELAWRYRLANIIVQKSTLNIIRCDTSRDHIFKGRMRVQFVTTRNLFVLLCVRASTIQEEWKEIANTPCPDPIFGDHILRLKNSDTVNFCHLLLSIIRP